MEQGNRRKDFTRPRLPSCRIMNDFQGQIDRNQNISPIRKIDNISRKVLYQSSSNPLKSCPVIYENENMYPQTTSQQTNGSIEVDREMLLDYQSQFEQMKKSFEKYKNCKNNADKLIKENGIQSYSELEKGNIEKIRRHLKNLERRMDLVRFHLGQPKIQREIEINKLKYISVDDKINRVNIEIRKMKENRKLLERKRAQLLSEISSKYLENRELISNFVETDVEREFSLRRTVAIREQRNKMSKKLLNLKKKMQQVAQKKTQQKLEKEILQNEIDVLQDNFKQMYTDMFGMKLNEVVLPNPFIEEPEETSQNGGLPKKCSNLNQCESISSDFEENENRCSKYFDDDLYPYDKNSQNQKFNERINNLNMAFLEKEKYKASSHLLQSQIDSLKKHLKEIQDFKSDELKKKTLPIITKQIIEVEEKRLKNLIKEKIEEARDLKSRSDRFVVKEKDPLSQFGMENTSFCNLGSGPSQTSYFQKIKSIDYIESQVEERAICPSISRENSFSMKNSKNKDNSFSKNQRKSESRMMSVEEEKDHFPMRRERRVRKEEYMDEYRMCKYN